MTWDSVSSSLCDNPKTTLCIPSNIYDWINDFHCLSQAPHYALILCSSSFSIPAHQMTNYFKIAYVMSYMQVLWQDHPNFPQLTTDCQKRLEFSLKTVKVINSAEDRKSIVLLRRQAARHQKVKKCFAHAHQVTHCVTRPEGWLIRSFIFYRLLPILITDDEIQRVFVD